MSDLIKCSYCNKIHDKYEDCDAKLKHKQKHKQNYNEEYNKCYNSKNWKRVREEVLKENNYCCEICMQLGVANYKDIQVHHVIKIIDNEDLMFDKSNLIVVCRQHHREIEGKTLKEVIDYIKLQK